MPRALVALTLVVVGFAGSARAQTGAPPPQPDPPGAQDASKSLATEANDPTSSLVLVNIRPIVAFDTVRGEGAGGELQVNAAGPLRKWLPFQQLIRVSLPLVQTTPGPGRTTGFGDITFFDVSSSRWKRMRWGVGVSLTFPTATDEALGDGKWQAGPALGFIVPVSHFLLAGAVFQNPISFAGDPDRRDVNGLTVSPTFTFNLKGGWFAGLSDLDWEFDWEDTDEHLVPLGVQFGRIVRMGRQPVSLSAELAYAAVHPKSAPYGKWQFAIEYILLFPERRSGGVRQ